LQRPFVLDLGSGTGIGGGALYAVYAEAYTVFLCVC